MSMYKQVSGKGNSERNLSEMSLKAGLLALQTLQTWHMTYDEASFIWNPKFTPY